VDEDIDLKVRAQYDDSLAPGANERYADRILAAGYHHPDSTTPGRFYLLAPCQGGDEISMIYTHPLPGVGQRLSAEEYRARTAPYVAAFGAEVYPGDLHAGLVRHAVRQFLAAGPGRSPQGDTATSR